MAWTITAGQPAKDPNNEQNVKLPVTLDDGAGRVLNIVLGPSNTLTVDYVRESVKRFIQQIEAADAIKSELDTIAGKTVTVKDPDPVDPDLATFRTNWQRLKRLLALQSTTPSTINKAKQIRDAIEAALVQNPAWIDDDRIG